MSLVRTAQIFSHLRRLGLHEIEIGEIGSHFCLTILSCSFLSMHSLDSNYVNLQEELNETKKALPSSGDCPICSKPFKKLKTHFNTCFIKKHAPQIDKQSNSVETSND